MKPILTRMIKSLFFILASVWVLLSALLYVFQSEFIYYPFSILNATPKNAGLTYEDIHLVTDDGLTIHGWFVPHENPRATLLFLHGNGGNISHRLDKLRMYNQLQLSVFIIDYRGYGMSEGHPTEQGTYLDAKTAWNYLTQKRLIPANDIIIYGESLGGAVASWLASRVDSGALIVESVFSSIADVGKHYYPYLAVRLIARFKYPVTDHVREVFAPVLVIHSPADEIIPFAMGRKVYMAANQPKEFLEITGDHNSGFLLSGDLYSDGLDRFIQTHFPRRLNAPALKASADTE